MAAGGTSTYSDPDDYEADFQEAKINLVFNSGGDFKARLTRLKLPNLHFLDIRESLPRIACIKLPPQRVCVAFATRLEAPTVWDGTEVRSGDIVVLGRGECMHQRTAGVSHWALLSWEPDYFARYGGALTGMDPVPPVARRILRPPRIVAAPLRRLHAKACRLAESKPKLAAHRQVARGLEQELLHLLVSCLTAGLPRDDTVARQRHLSIMNRFEGVLVTHLDQQPEAAVICASIGISERTLRVCCAEFLGMGPSHYIRLRRLNLVRAALRHADPAENVRDVARRYGFSEPGRFAVRYRNAFGEKPSTTLWGPRLKVDGAASAESA